MHPYTKFIEEKIKSMPSNFSTIEIQKINRGHTSYYSKTSLDDLLILWKRTAVEWDLLDNKLEPVPNLQPPFEEVMQMEGAIKNLSALQKKWLLYEFMTNYSKLNAKPIQVSYSTEKSADYPDLGSAGDTDQEVQAHRALLHSSNPTPSLIDHASKYDSFESVRCAMINLVASCKSFVHQGSSGLITQIDPRTQTLTVGSIGNMSSYALVKKNNGELKIIPLTVPRSTSDQLEQLTALKTHQHLRQKDTIDEYLDASKMVGSLGFTGRLPSSMLDISQLDLNQLASDDECVVISSSHDLFEHQPENSLTIPLALQDKSAKEIAQYVVTCYGQQRPQDRMAAHLLPLNRYPSPQNNKPVIYGVFNGHGGDECAKWAKISFESSTEFDSSLESESYKKIKNFVFTGTDHEQEDQAIWASAKALIFEDASMHTMIIENNINTLFRVIYLENQGITLQSAKRLIILYLTYCVRSSAIKSFEDNPSLITLNNLVTGIVDQFEIESLDDQTLIGLRKYFFSLENSSSDIPLSLFRLLSSKARDKLLEGIPNLLLKTHTPADKVKLLTDSLDNIILLKNTIAKGCLQNWLKSCDEKQLKDVLAKLKSARDEWKQSVMRWILSSLTSKEKLQRALRRIQEILLGKEDSYQAKLNEAITFIEPYISDHSSADYERKIKEEMTRREHEYLRKKAAEPINQPLVASDMTPDRSVQEAASPTARLKSSST